MADEHALIKERERAHLAKQIADNPLIAEFFAEARSALIKSWEGASTPEYREDAWRYVQLLKQFEKFFNTTITTGKMAEMALAEMQEKANGRTSTKH